MHLCIDAGNTQVKYGVFKNRRLIYKETSEQLDVQLAGRIIRQFYPEKAMLSSVRKPQPAFVKLLKNACSLTELSHTTPLPIVLDYETPETLGRDRIACAVAAWVKYRKQNSLVINAGTCITFDIVTHEGVYKGGAISPGIEMRYKAMHEFTARLPYVTDRKPVRITGKSTTASLNAGVLNHVCYEVEGAIRFYTSHFEGLRVIITGGNGPFLAKRLKNGIFAASDLVLTGLNEILIYNA